MYFQPGRHRQHIVLLSQRNIIRTVSILFVGLLLFSANANNKIPITKDQEYLKINSSLQVFSTADTLNSIEAYHQIQRGQMSAMLEKENPGMQENAAYWLLFELTNQTESPLKYLEVRNPRIDSIKVFRIESDSVIEKLYTAGDHLHFDARPVRNRHFIFPLTISPGSTQTYLVNVDKRASSNKFPMFIYDELYLAKKITNESLVFGLFYGLMFLMMFVSLLIGIYSRQSIFIYYTIYLASLFLWSFSREGFSSQFLLANTPQINDFIYPIGTSLGSICLVFYIQSFLRTKEIIPLFHRSMRYILVLFIAIFLAWITLKINSISNSSFLLAIRYVLLFIMVLFAFVAAIKARKKYPNRAILFLIGYSAIYAGITYEILAEYGITDVNNMLVSPIMMGYLVEIIALSIAMGFIVMETFKERKELQSSYDKLKDEVRQPPSNSFLNLKSKAVLDLNHIMYIRSDSHYLEFYLSTRDRPEIDRYRLKDILKQLPDRFVQVHKSYIVNMDFVKIRMAKKVMLKDGNEIPVSRSFKEKVQEAFSTPH